MSLFSNLTPSLRIICWNSQATNVIWEFQCFFSNNLSYSRIIQHFSQITNVIREFLTFASTKLKMRQSLDTRSHEMEGANCWLPAKKHWSRRRSKSAWLKRNLIERLSTSIKDSVTATRLRPKNYQTGDYLQVTLVSPLPCSIWIEPLISKKLSITMLDREEGPV